MDSEHRHELKSNELAELITHFPQFLKRNANTIIGIALIVTALVTWPMFTKMSRAKTVAEESKVANAIQMLNQDIRNALQGYQNDPDGLDPLLNTVLANANALLDQASETDNTNLQAMAHIKAAQAIRTELHLRREMVSAETIESQTQKAQEAYEKAAELADTPTLKAMAQFGIGLCAEERGQTEQAADTYKSIVDNEEFSATVIPELAQQRLDNIDDNTVAFTFEDDTPQEADVTTPAPENTNIIDMGTVEGAAGQVRVLPETEADETTDQTPTDETTQPGSEQ